MDKANRKRRVGIITPPDVRYLARTPSPKRPRDQESPGINDYDEGEGSDGAGVSMETEVAGRGLPTSNEIGFINDNKVPGNKIFNDSIHGHIELHPLCVKIIDTPQFQRLRNIKQLGGCYFVFPGASHHRFEHCIGTCHLAGRLVKSLRKRQPDLGITEEDMLCVQIAGLCHDLGHGPFSHLFDVLFIPKARPFYGWKHENASVDMFDHMVEVNNLWPSLTQYNLTEKDVIFIKELIAGKTKEGNDLEEWPYKGRGPEKSYLYEIVANKRTGIDVDKFDYFSRDCHCLGISNSFDHKYNAQIERFSFDLERLFSRYMKFSRVIRVKGKLQICVRDKEAGNIYDMFHTRNSLFRRAYQHKTSNIIEQMITEALLKADKSFLLQGSKGKMLSISESIDDMVAYTQLTDHVYYQILSSTDPALDEARSILMRIQTRDLYKCIGQTILRNHRDREEIREICEEIASFDESEAPIEADDFVIHLVNFDYGMKDRNPIDEVRFYQKDKLDVPMIVRKEEVSHMLPQMFAEQHMRVYFRKNDRECLEIAKRCFITWCEGRQCTTPKGGDALAELTPMKSSQDGNHGNLERRLSFKE